MNGIIIINKEKGYTSRDTINKLSKIFNTKKIGHTGTLDPMAEGVLVVCLGKALKICEELTSNEKEYIASVILGMSTDTLDIDKNATIIKNVPCYKTKEEIEKVLLSYNKTYLQEVPKYSAVKVNGKKLYEYAREKKEVVLPKKEVTVSNIKLLDVTYNNDKTQFTFKCTVSKGTFIRSLIRDIGLELQAPAVMTSLIRTRQGNFNIDNSYTLKDIENGNYKILQIDASLPDIPKIHVDNKTLFKIKNGAPIEKLSSDKTFILDENDKIIALYKNEADKSKAYKMFI